jgi:hypothetical protein
MKNKEKVLYDFPAVLEVWAQWRWYDVLVDVKIAA